MTEDEALERLAAACEVGDEEDEHNAGDAIARDALRALGWTRLADALQARAEAGWWYA